MIKQNTQILMLLLILFSCQKKPIINGVNIQDIISINGMLTDSLESQIITITKNIPIASLDVSDFDPVYGAKIQVEQNGIIYNFSETSSTAYVSDIPFSIANGQEFTIRYEIDTAILQAKLIAPSSITLNNIISSIDEEAISISVDAQSLSDQFFVYKVYLQNIDSTANSSEVIWEENITLKAYQIGEIKAGSSTIALSVDGANTFAIDQAGTTVKIELTPITKKVKEYFVSLNKYFETIATYNLYINSPRFYNNHFYGMTYSTSWTEVIGSL